jgi:hypothetical protein
MKVLMTAGRGCNVSLPGRRDRSDVDLFHPHHRFIAASG